VVLLSYTIYHVKMLVVNAQNCMHVHIGVLIVLIPKCKYLLCETMVLNHIQMLLMLQHKYLNEITNSTVS